MRSSTLCLLLLHNGPQRSSSTLQKCNLIIKTFIYTFLNAAARGLKFQTCQAGNHIWQRPATWQCTQLEAARSRGMRQSSQPPFRAPNFFLQSLFNRRNSTQFVRHKQEAFHSGQLTWCCVMARTCSGSLLAFAGLVLPADAHCGCHACCCCCFCCCCCTCCFDLYCGCSGAVYHSG